MTDSTLYFSNGNDLLAVDKSTGNMKVLLTNQITSSCRWPWRVTADRARRRTRGTEIFQLWGVDAASGSQSCNWTRKVLRQSTRPTRCLD